MAWFTSWFPSLPTINITIPAAIQGRFLSFLLRKCLGRFLRPGQLDHYQIDSQIGSGYVQVNQLELNPETINAYLEGLPLSLREGSVSAVKARIPWPNPLAAAVGLSLTSAHLIFDVAQSRNRPIKPDVDLAESVASVADSFVHDELLPKEEATMWHSLHQHASQSFHEQDSRHIPGALGASMTSDDTSKLDYDLAGVSVFASLIENLLARFEFDARDVKISLVHAKNMCLILSLEEMRYQTDAKLGSLDTSSDSTQGEHRTLSFSGLSLSATQLDGKKHPFTSTATFSRCGSPQMGGLRSSSRTSSLDGETQLTMSQSLAFLPLRPDSPADSVTSSMYQSALSMASTIPPLSDASVPQLQSREEPLLSFGSRPIIVQVMTPPPGRAGNEDARSMRTTTSPTEELHVVVSMNIVACIMKQWQVGGLLHLSQVLAPDGKNASPICSSPSKPQFPPVKVTICAQVFVLLLDHNTFSKDTASSLSDFFDKPLVPPKWNRGYIRIQLDTISGSIALRTTSQGKALTTTRDTDVTVADLSVLSFTPNVHHNDKADELAAFPLIITDRYLSVQYSNQHMQPENGIAHPILPTFDTVDWTQESSRNLGSRLSHWRSRSTKSESVPINPAFRIRSRSRMTSTQNVNNEVEIQVIPLHIRLDLENLIQTGGLLSFFDGLSFELDLDETASAYSDDTINSPRMNKTNNSEELESPFGEPVFSHKLGAPQLQAASEERDPSRLQLTITIPVLRCSLRCPSPPGCHQRSGIVVIDIHEIIATTGSTPCQRSTKFTSRDYSPMQRGETPDEFAQWKLQFRRAVLASSVIGTKSTNAFASIGCLRDAEDTQNQFSPLQPCIQAMKPNLGLSEKSPIRALSVDIPAVHADLSKTHIYGLQYFADDLTQFFERMSGCVTTLNAEFVSWETNMIGSRYFAKSRVMSLNSSMVETPESVVKLNVTEAFFRVNVPRRDDDMKCRPFDLKVLDLDILLEINPNGQQQTVLTLGALDFSVLNTNKGGTKESLFSLTSPHSLTTIPKSIIKFRLSTSTGLETQTKETRVKLTMCGFTYTFFPDLNWIHDLIDFGKNPPGTFESVIPSDRTRVSVKVVDGAIRLFAPNYPGALVAHLQETEFSTDVVGDSRDSSFHINASSVSLLALDDCVRQETMTQSNHLPRGVATWTTSGYALFVDLPDLDMFVVHHLSTLPEWKVDIHRMSSRLHICADTLSAVSSLFSDFGTLWMSSEDENVEPPNHVPSVFNTSKNEESNLLSSVEDLTFKRMPEVGPAPDMINDDLPTNMYYLDDSFGAAAGLREICEDDLEDFHDEKILAQSSDDANVISRVGGETVKIFDPNGLDVVEDYFLTIPPEANRDSGLRDSKISVRVFDGNFDIFLYDGYDWSRTRKAIEEEVKEMRKRLAKIRQLVANGHVEDSSLDDTSALLFNSIHIGLDDDEGAFGEPAALIAAIDRELKDDDTETTSWQSLPTFTSKQPRAAPIRVHGKRLTRPKGPSIEFCLQGLRAEYDKFYDDDPLVSRTLVTVRDVEILDHIKTSTWKKFLTPLKSDAKGNVRETESDMVRVELRGVRPVAGHSSEEARMKARILPLRLYVDQDAVDFMKKFFSFEDPAAFPNSSASQEAYIQHAEIFPVDLKLDYKPRRVDYRALKQGKTIELMNFFHFDGAEMTLRHITLAGITGWGRLFEMLNDLWTPDVKATQLAEVISGVAPISSLVNVGSGVADLILLPISQYKKDGRIVRGVQKGTKAFVKSTAIEVVKMGAKLATGTQVILEQAEGILGGNFEAPITVEPLQSGEDFVFENDEVEEEDDLRSKYAQQPADVKEGVQYAYKSLKKNLSSAAQTILAVPMEVYERSGNEGPVRSVIRAVPIAVLKPMIGASEAISKTLQGLHNTLDPNVRHENEAKYKR